VSELQLMKKTNSRRNSSGGMLGLAWLIFGILLVVICVGLSFGSMFFFQSMLQKFADDLALSGACRLNDGNRIGQMNDLTARCRQLVFASRSAAESNLGSSPELQSLSQQLLEEAQRNAVALDGERARLQKLSQAEATATMSNDYHSNQSRFNLVFPWINVKIANSSLASSFGSVKGTDSNVKHLSGIPDLADYDQAQKYVDKASGLYTGNLDARIPQPDDQYRFKLASLAPSVRGQIAPARLIQEGDLQLAADDHIPSALKVDLRASLSLPGLNGESGIVHVTSAAATNGANPSIQ
jgi:hypothetical protein